MRPSQPNPPLHGLNKTLSQIGLVVLFLGYWIFVNQLEQVDITQSTTAWVQTLVAALEILPFSNFFITVAEFFTWRVIRNLIPFIVGWWLANQAILGMLESFYGLENSHASCNAHEPSISQSNWVRQTNGTQS